MKNVVQDLTSGGLLGVWGKWVKHAKYIYNIQDFNPEQVLDDTTFTISTSASGILGIDYTYESGDNKADIYVDGELFESPTVTFNYDFSQRHILVVSDDCTVKNEIKVVFTSKEQSVQWNGTRSTSSQCGWRVFSKL